MTSKLLTKINDLNDFNCNDFNDLMRTSCQNEKQKGALPVKLGIQILNNSKLFI